MKKNVYLMILIVSVLSFACTSNVETEKPDEVPEVLVENDKVIVERLSGISNELVFYKKNT